MGWILVGGCGFDRRIVDRMIAALLDFAGSMGIIPRTLKSEGIPWETKKN
jgi:hypothetical protein